MATFLIGIIILIVGGYLYGLYCEKVFGPDDRETPAITKADGVDFVVMKKWKNSLINLLNIAGTGPVLGPIQGILFGPVAFITIPLGCVLAGSMHDYFSGMISMRNGGAQMPKLIKKYLGGKVFGVYNVIIWILMLLVGVVFVYTPGDLIVSELIKQQPVAANPTTWIVYAGINNPSCRVCSNRLLFYQFRNNQVSRCINENYTNQKHKYPDNNIVYTKYFPAQILFNQFRHLCSSVTHGYHAGEIIMH
mgnify:CR=1 FL=1